MKNAKKTSKVKQQKPKTIGVVVSPVTRQRLNDMVTARNGADPERPLRFKLSDLLREAISYYLAVKCDPAMPPTGSHYLGE